MKSNNTRNKLHALMLMKTCAALAIVLPLSMMAETTGQVLDIKSERQLFVDKYIVGNLTDARLKMHEPRPAGVALRYDGPTEDEYCNFTYVLKDGGVFRMYYRGRVAPKKGDVGDQTTCYAESRDGINWKKRNLGLVEVDGSRNNNVILERAEHNFCPFIDTRPGVPASERYKAVMSHGAKVPLRDVVASKRKPEQRVDLRAFVSADGIRWRLLREESIVHGQFNDNFDGPTAIFWSEAEQCYVLYARHYEEKKRSMARATSKDFLTWTPQVMMTYSDTGTTIPSVEFYTNQTTPYFRAPQIYIALPASYHENRRVLTESEEGLLELGTLAGRADYISDGLLLTTRPGTTRYDFVFRESFVRPGIGISHWVSRTNFPGLGIVPTSPREISIYVQRNTEQKSGYLERLTLRTDGFVSVNAPYDGGEFLTKTIRFKGEALEMNYATGAGGSIRVEIQDENGAPLPGYSIKDCPEIIGDQITRIVSWKFSSNVSPFAGRPVRLRFVMRDADLYSFRFR